MDKKQSAYIINGQTVPWSVVGMLMKKCQTPYETALCLYRAREKEKIVPYIICGIRKGWIFNVTLDEEQHPEKAKAWIEKNTLRYEEFLI